MKIEIDTLKKVGEMVKKKPDMYHHVCLGGGSARVMLDVWSTKKVVYCRYAARSKDMARPMCGACSGEHREETRVLPDCQEYFNNGIDALVRAMEGQ